MALYRCKNCGEEGAFGPMPTTSCGLVFIPALVAALASPETAWPWLHWFSLLLPVPVFFVVYFLTFVVPSRLEWACLHLTRCPGCGKRRWSAPFTEGFGL